LFDWRGGSAREVRDRISGKDFARELRTTGHERRMRHREKMAENDQAIRDFDISPGKG
jgi:hypothetical protein